MAVIGGSELAEGLSHFFSKELIYGCCFEHGATCYAFTLNCVDREWLEVFISLSKTDT